MMNRRDAMKAGIAIVGGVAGGVLTFKPGIVIGSPRGEGEPTSIERTTFDGHVEYQPETETVKWSSMENPEGPEHYSTEPFDDWASRRVKLAASHAVTAAVRNRIDTQMPMLAATDSKEYIGTVILVGADIDRIRRSDLPEISKSTFVDAAPRSVEATVRLAERTHTETMPVFVEDGPPVMIA